jgi:hypothetical protein
MILYSLRLSTTNILYTNVTKNMTNFGLPSKVRMMLILMGHPLIWYCLSTSTKIYGDEINGLMLTLRLIVLHYMCSLMHILK